MKTTSILRLIVTAAMLCPIVFTGCSKEEEQLIDPNKKPDKEEPEKPEGPTVLDGEIFAYPAIETLQTSSDFTVTANGVDIWVEEYDVELPSAPFKQGEEDFVNKVRPYLGTTQRTAFARFSTTGGTAVSINSPSVISKCTVHPKSRNIAVSGEGTNTVTFNITGPENLYVEIPGMPELYIFADAPETDRPDENDPTYYYFGPGVHEIEGGQLLIANVEKRNVYIAAGALVKGCIRFDNIKGSARLHGRGILDATITGGVGNVVYQHYSSGVAVEDIMARTSQRGWMCWLYQSQYSSFSNVKIIGYGANNDGIPATSPRGLTVKNCFIRTTDDCISLKTENKDIDADVAIEGSTMYGVASSDGVMVGYECKGRLTNVKVKDCDIIGGRGTTILGYGHAGFTIGCDGPGPIENVTFENVRVENKVFENNMLAIVTDGKAYMPNTSSFHGKPGSIKGITLKNVSWENAGMPMRFVGHGADNTIKDILFENCTAGGNLIDGTDTYFMTKISPNLNEFVSPSEIRVRNR